MVLNLGAAIVNAISCTDAISTLSPCVPFLIGLPPTPSDACCAAAQKLDKLASTSPAQRKNLCKCFVEAIKIFPVNLEKVQRLPKLCKLHVTLPSNPNVDCSKF
ncbi:PREDICTED: non-specific lipid-transfer protein-like [Populus euphratica]|uniref:Non-specific lipid-transfer protein-like n=1 Tax=Populus euphratica TaxID=75702 RepID=A0AAJ6WZZ6_POPEU|nr:PREDICTED: non-specific lipid-transfer protein-like [Populus euphratica]